MVLFIDFFPFLYDFYCIITSRNYSSTLTSSLRLLKSSSPLSKVNDAMIIYNQYGSPRVSEAS